MLRKANDLTGYKLGAQDGEIGRVKQFYFDDESWTVRYLVADTGLWLSLRKVLISPFAVTGVNDAGKIVDVNLTREQIEASPPIEADKPVSRQYEEQYFRYYGWPLYWHGPWLWGPAPHPGGFMTAPLPVEPPPPGEKDRKPGDPHLRSMDEVTGYHIHARDGEVGHVEDFLFDDEDWAIRYLVVDTRNWWPGKRVLLAPQWITGVSWHESELRVDLNRDTIKDAPEFDESSPITRDFEIRLFHYYRREGYWKGSETHK
jgi:hypothetical protein